MKLSRDCSVSRDEPCAIVRQGRERWDTQAAIGAYKAAAEARGDRNVAVLFAGIREATLAAVASRMPPAMQVRVTHLHTSLLSPCAQRLSVSAASPFDPLGCHRWWTCW